MTAPNTELALARITRISLAESTLDSALQTVAEVMAELLPAADAVSVTVLERGRPRTAASTDPLAIELDERQYALADGPCLDAATTAALSDLPDTSTGTRWPAFAREAAARGIGAVLSTPLPGQRELPVGINAYSRSARAFDEAAREAAHAVAVHAGVVVANVRLFETQRRVAEQLQTAMQSRAVIEQAKGVLMAQRGTGPEEAFALLVDLSQRSNRKLRDVAQAVVETVTAGEG